MLEPKPKKYTDAATPTSEIINNQLTPLNGGTAATAIATPDANHNGPANWCTASHTSRDSRTSNHATNTPPAHRQYTADVP